jgi:hypothetical protein
MSRDRVSFRLRASENPDVVYGDDLSDEDAAFQRAQQFADFYGHPIEVCRVTFGRFARVVGSPVLPGPTAPSPIAEARNSTDHR